MTIEQLAVWWGASIATLVLVWDVIKWKQERNRIYLNVGKNRIKLYPGEETNKRKYISIEVVNNGTNPITVASLLGEVYKARKGINLRRKPEKYFFITKIEDAHPPPFKLDPGERWIALLDQVELRVPPIFM